MRKLLFFIVLLLGWLRFAYAVDAAKLLSPEEAFVPQVQVGDQGINVQFAIADGYYLYQAKITAETTPDGVLSEPTFSPGEEKHDEFFGKQMVYHHAAQAVFPFRNGQPGSFRLKLTYQGCAEAGVCYPPSESVFEISGSGLYQAGQPVQGVNRFLSPANQIKPSMQPETAHRFTLSWDTLNANLLAFFLAGIALSFTACMYPLIPIVSGIVVGDRNAGKGRAFVLTLAYTQGLALTYTVVGMIAGLTGALLTVWLQQPWIVLPAAAVMVLLALSMFGWFNIQLPSAVQSFFQNQSNRFSGGKLVSVFVMGMFSALIVGPCVAPPLAAVLGYIGKTGDAVLGGLALYAMALGTGVPLILIGMFGGHILPRAGSWMNGIKYAFGFILLAVAVYLATPYIGYAAAAAMYTLIAVIPAGLLLVRFNKQTGCLKALCGVLGVVLLAGGVWFGVQSGRQQPTVLHNFLTLHPAPAHTDSEIRRFTSVAALKAAMETALREDADSPVLLDFYADWCVSCKEMEAYTLSDAEVRKNIPLARMFQIDVTENLPEHRALLKEYGLFGPPGIFAVYADGTRSEALLGFVQSPQFIAWYRSKLQRAPSQ